MHGDDCAHPTRCTPHRAIQGRGVECEGLRVDVDKQWPRPDVRDRLRGRRERERRERHHVVFADSQRVQGQYQRIGPIGHPNGVLDLAVRGKLPFERFDLGSVDEG
jgi:hypothetical protein